MFGIEKFRWFSDDRTQAKRDAKAAWSAPEVQRIQEAEHENYEWMVEKYIGRGRSIPDYVPEMQENDRLQKELWNAYEAELAERRSNPERQLPIGPEVFAEMDRDEIMERTDPLTGDDVAVIESLHDVDKLDERIKAELAEAELTAAPADDLEPESDGPESASDDKGDPTPVPTEQKIAEPEASLDETDVAEAEVTAPPVREIEPPAPSDEKDALTEHIIKELRSGDHRQVCGAWQDRGIFGADKECLWQMTMNTTGMDMDEIRGVYHGETTVGDGFDLNDSQRKSFSEIADHFETNVLSPKRKRELDEYELGQ